MIEFRKHSLINALLDGTHSRTIVDKVNIGEVSKESKEEPKLFTQKTSNGINILFRPVGNILKHKKVAFITNQGTINWIMKSEELPRWMKNRIESIGRNLRIKPSQEPS